MRRPWNRCEIYASAWVCWRNGAMEMIAIERPLSRYTVVRCCVCGILSWVRTGISGYGRSTSPSSHGVNTCKMKVDLSACLCGERKDLEDDNNVLHQA